MRLQKIDKNQMVAAFLLNIAEGQRTNKAARNAGFSTPQRDIAKLMHSPEFSVSVSEAIRHRVKTTLAPEAMAVAEELLRDKATSARVRWDIAKTFLAVGAGLVAPKAGEPEAPPQDISQMTAQDIMSLRESLNREMEQRSSGAKLIEHQPANESQQAETYSHLD